MYKRTEDCAFPFVFPDCSQSVKSSVCERVELKPRSYNSCVLLDIDREPWCYTRVYKNRSHYCLEKVNQSPELFRSLIRGEYGYCSAKCTETTSRYFCRDCLMISPEPACHQPRYSPLQPGQLSVRGEVGGATVRTTRTRPLPLLQPGQPLLLRAEGPAQLLPRGGEGGHSYLYYLTVRGC